MVVKFKMEIYLHNTLGNKKEKFVPIEDGHVSMYNCGPTVYNYAHIGNLRSYVFADTLKRMFEWNGYVVKQVINLTDVGHLTSDADFGDDKVEKAAKREGKKAKDITDFYIKSFFDDLDNLNIERSKIKFPKATEYISEQIEMIKTLEEKGFTYRTSDGIYFDTEKFPNYGRLGNINLSGLEEGARIGLNVERRNITDFALWKFSPQDEKREQEWPSPWGIGFPGWHIECSAMSKKLLGPTFDIHTGGIDHIPVHHNNEIAQSTCANDAVYVNYWMHNAHINIGGDKMAKSEGNFIRLETLIEKNVSPLAYRYLLLSARYSSPMEFSWEALVGSETAVKKIKHFMSRVILATSDILETEDKNILDDYKKTFTEFINDDLDTPKALAMIWEIMKDNKLSLVDKQALITDFDNVLGLRLSEKEMEMEIPLEVENFMLARDKAREEKNWQLSDQLREKIEALGFSVQDTENGTKVVKK